MFNLWPLLIYRDKEQPYEKNRTEKETRCVGYWFFKLVTVWCLFSHLCGVRSVFTAIFINTTRMCYATYAVAQQALQQACEYSGQIPEKCLLSDHGKQFSCYSFEETKNELKIKSPQPGEKYRETWVPIDYFCL